MFLALDYTKGQNGVIRFHEVPMAIHRMTGSPEYRAWSHMKGRCYNHKNKSFPEYGGKGIVVCREWVNDFTCFYADMGPRPSPKHSIDRRDGAGNYSKENCRWATKEEQSQNRPEFVVVLTHDGKAQTIAEWARDLGVHPQTLYGRHNLGWPALRILAQGPSHAIRSDNKILEFDGRCQTVAQWTREIGLSRSTVRERLRRGWSVERALSKRDERCR